MICTILHEHICTVSRVCMCVCGCVYVCVSALHIIMASYKILHHLRIHFAKDYKGFYCRK